MKGHASQSMQESVQGLDGRAVCGESCHRRSLHLDCSRAFSAPVNSGGRVHQGAAQTTAGLPYFMFILERRSAGTASDHRL